MSAALKTLRLIRSSKSGMVKPVTLRNKSGSNWVITSRKQYSRKSVRYINTGIRVANLISFSCICLRSDLVFFSSSVSSRFSFSDSFFCCCFAFLICSDLFIIVSMSCRNARKPSMFCNARIASAFPISLSSVALSTLTSKALSQRRANKVEVVPLIAISKIPAASISFMELPSYARMGRKRIKSPTFVSGLASLILSRQL